MHVEVTAKDAQFVRELVHRQAAILLDSEKDYFIQMRLTQLAESVGGSIEDLVEKARRGIAGATARIIEAVTTHETYFFRDVRPFDVLKKDVLPGIVAANKATRRLNIWCAACSSGQEPYSLAMMLRESFAELKDWRVRILATDLSEQILAKAREGVYTQMEVNRGLPAAYLTKYFERAGLHWKVRDDVRSLIEFRKLNLVEPWSLNPTPDLVLMRNVLIYFDLDSKRRILDRVRQQIVPGGALFLGAAETTLNVADGWERVANDKHMYYKAKVL
jgi:chemotaxis protein methyltransferase CheR